MEINLTDAGKLLANSESIIISTHVMPDGDGLGAEIALFHYLSRLGKNVRIVNPDPVPDRYKFLDKLGAIEVGLPAGGWKPFDLAVIMDTNDHKRLGSNWKKFEEHAKNILFFDHHPNLDEVTGEIANPEPLQKNIFTVVDVKSSSIGELLYRLFHVSHDELDKDSASFRLSAEIALGLYVSIITDTNSFRYSRTTALSHRIAADLIDFGLQPEDIYQNVYATKSIGHLKLIGEVLAKAQELPDAVGGRSIVWVEISKALRTKYNASSDDTQAIVNFLLLVKDAELLLLFREEDDHRIKVSLKSRGSIRVNSVAQEFGGGGHEFASGFTTKGKLEDIRRKVIERLQK